MIGFPAAVPFIANACETHLTPVADVDEQINASTTALINPPVRRASIEPLCPNAVKTPWLPSVQSCSWCWTMLHRRSSRQGRWL